MVLGVLWESARPEFQAVLLPLSCCGRPEGSAKPLGPHCALSFPLLSGTRSSVMTCFQSYQLWSENDEDTLACIHWDQLCRAGSEVCPYFTQYLSLPLWGLPALWAGNRHGHGFTPRPCGSSQAQRTESQALFYAPTHPKLQGRGSWGAIQI